MKRLCVLVICLLLLCGAALADDVCTISDLQSGVTTDSSYIRLKVPVNDEGQVLLTITGPDGGTVYQRDYGVRSESFRTEDIYLRLSGSQTVYQVTLQAGGAVYSFPVERIPGKLSGAAACTAGYPLSDMSGVEGWRTATLLRVKDGSVTVPVHASGTYEVGTATFRISGGQLTVTVDLDKGVSGKVESSKVYVATSALTARQLGRNQFNGVIGSLGKPIDLHGAAYAAVYVKLTLSFDPAGAASAPATVLDGQPDLWDAMQQETANEANG